MFHELQEIGRSRAEGRGTGKGRWAADGGARTASHGVSGPWWAGGLVAGVAVPSPGEQTDDFARGRGRAGVTPSGRRNWLPPPS